MRYRRVSGEHFVKTSIGHTMGVVGRINFATRARSSPHAQTSDETSALQDGQRVILTGRARSGGCEPARRREC
jgi:hypothetical protein